jgi:hypothetical protein
MTINEIACCGAYCKTCIEQMKEKYPKIRHCPGCKFGYKSGERDINRAKCKIKLCCFKERKFETCADCSDFPCEIVEVFYGKGREKYRKHIVFIKEHGYEEFLKRANKWKRATGKL